MVRNSAAGLVFALVFLCVVAPAPADLVLQGPEIQVHLNTVHTQLAPDVAPQGGGGFVVGWMHIRQDGGENRDLLFRRFDADGLPLTAEIQGPIVSDRFSSTLYAVESDAAGDFIAAFATQILCCNFFTIPIYERFDADGFSKGTSQNIGLSGGESNFFSSLAVAADGSALIGWGAGLEAPSADQGAYLLFVDSTGMEVPPEGTQLNNKISRPHLAAAPGGGFLMDLLGEAFWLAADGTATGPGTPLDLATTGGLIDIEVMVLPSGVGLFVWSVWDVPADTSEFFARRIGTDGTLIGPIVPLLDVPIPGSVRVDATVLPNGEFVVVWDQAAVSGGPGNIFARQFLANGVPLSPATLVNPSDFGDEREPRVAAAGGDGIVVVWENTDGQDGDEGGIYAQRLSNAPPPIFVDGFESGDTTAWSATTP